MTNQFQVTFSIAKFWRAFIHAALVWVLLCPLGVSAEELRTGGDNSRPAQESTKSQAARVDQLIAQLGSTRYVERRAAEQELLTIGLEAFDQVLAGTKHLDPEISASCEYLLGELTVRWDRREDSPSVRQYLHSYNSFSDADRRHVIRGLALLPEGEGLAALGRICRYDTSDELSQVAALLVLRPDKLYPELPPEAAAMLESEVGNSPRAGAEWIRLFAMQLRDGASAIPAWRKAVEQAAQDAETHDKDDAQQANLLWNLLRVELTAGKNEPVEKTVAQLVETRPEYAAQSLTRVVEWIAEAENWSALERVLDQFQDQLLLSKQGAYAIALARNAQGRNDLAEQLAEKAFQQPANLQRIISGLDERVRLGKQLLDRGQTDWGRRELQSVIEEQPILSETGVAGRWFLFESMFDREEYQAAAEVLDQLNSTISETAMKRREFRMLLQQAEGFIPSSETLRSREAFARASAARLQGDRAEQIKQLETAVAADPTDADVIIAMYRVPDAPPEFQEKALALIDELSRTFQQQIEEEPDNPMLYNQWAWLVSNTTGDYHKAVRYSQRSLELRPGDAGYLDTLGRCYFATGELELAIKTQREAVSLQPHMQVMQRQLKLFEQAESNKPPAEGNGQ